MPKQNKELAFIFLFIPMLAVLIGNSAAESPSEEELWDFLQKSFRNAVALQIEKTPSNTVLHNKLDQYLTFFSGF